MMVSHTVQMVGRRDLVTLRSASVTYPSGVTVAQHSDPSDSSPADWGDPLLIARSERLGGGGVQISDRNTHARTHARTHAHTLQLKCILGVSFLNNMHKNLEIDTQVMSDRDRA